MSSTTLIAMIATVRPDRRGFDGGGDAGPTEAGYPAAGGYAFGAGYAPGAG
ncbi:hypothetical protein ACTJKK_09055 [Microbacterium sp. 22179]|uniref:hypothetical protein n=1 Tax=Microbacterium sp. 22179 TaxID=3453886 RepID=UPI003F85A4AE|nr:hypothetical protein [Microbacterium sp.]